MGAVRGEEDAADVGGDFCAQLETRDVGLGVLLEVELAALPGDGGEDGAVGGGEAGMVIADEEQRPRFWRLWRKSRQWTSASLRATLAPRIWRWPSRPMPRAMGTAQSITRPPWRTFS